MKARPPRIRRDSAQWLCDAIIGAYGWLPDMAWRLTLSEALPMLRARKQAVGELAVAVSLALAAQLAGGADGRAIINALLGGSDEPLTLAEEYGPGVANEVADLERRQAKWLQKHARG